MLEQLEDKLLAKGELILCEEIDGDTFKKVCGSQDTLRKVIVNCEGGSFYDAMGIADILVRNKINVHGTGAVMSAALLLFVAGCLRTASANTQFMYHCSSFPESGNSFKDKKRALQQAEAEEWQAAHFMASRTKMSAEFWKQKADEGDFYFTSEQALEFGVISSII